MTPTCAPREPLGTTSRVTTVQGSRSVMVSAFPMLTWGSMEKHQTFFESEILFRISLLTKIEEPGGLVHDAANSCPTYG